MTYTEAALKSKTVKDLKEIARELGVPAGGRKEELIAAILAAEAPAGDEADDQALADAADDLGDDAAAEAGAGDAAAAGSTLPSAAATTAAGKHQSIVFALADKQPDDHKKAHIAAIKVLSDEERAIMRAKKFGLAAQGGTSKPTAGGKAAAGGISPGGMGVGLEEEIKKLQRAQKFGNLSAADEKKLQGLLKKQAAQKQREQLAIDKATLMDPDVLKKREERFGASLLKSSSDPKAPDKMAARAAKFGKKPAAQVVTAPSTADDAARKKARLERFAKSS